MPFIPAPSIRVTFCDDGAVIVSDYYFADRRVEMTRAAALDLLEELKEHYG